MPEGYNFLLVAYGPGGVPHVYPNDPNGAGGGIIKQGSENFLAVNAPDMVIDPSLTLDSEESSEEAVEKDEEDVDEAKTEEKDQKQYVPEAHCKEKGGEGGEAKKRHTAAGKNYG
jgi:hypothetical protein